MSSPNILLEDSSSSSSSSSDDLLLKPPSTHQTKPGTPLPQELLHREMGISNQRGQKRKRHVIGNKLVSDTFASTADFNLLATSSSSGGKNKLDGGKKFKLPTGARTTFHMAFSMDGKLVASCHGDHCIYVCEIKTGKVIKTLSGHLRTPWCVVFHPTQNDILASGCLAGHVRVWDLKGGSELLITDSGTVIASLAFHPTVRLLAIGTFNEVVFWDWSRGDTPLARTTTQNHREKVRLVRFDSTGRSLITGITNFPTAPPPPPPPQASTTTSNPSLNLLRNLGELDPDIQEELEERQDRFQESYRQLVSHYEDLVQHYHTFLRRRVPRVLRGAASSSATSSMSQSSPPPFPFEAVRQQQTFQNTRNDDPPQPSSQPVPSSHLLPPTPSTSTSTPQQQQPTTPREFGSIEALAQNIMEMQNLCSQARQRVRLGPPTVETQHVMELQQIRQHLEVLQDQTRRLQHSIHATLTSLASGSLAVMQNATTTVTSQEEGERPPISPVVQPQEEVQRPRRSISPASTSSSTSFFRISVNSNPDRMRVPPVVRYNDERRRIVTREFVIDGNHARNCPFNLNHPPPLVGNRTRCLIEDQDVELEPWPGIETGMAGRTRTFAGVEDRPNTTQNQQELNLRVFLTVRGTADDIEMSENWQRNFLSALVPSAVREGRRGRNIRIRRNYLRSQVPNRLNNSFVRSFYIRVDADLVPVYSSHETPSGQEIRDSLGSNVFVFPISVFFNDFDSHQLIGIYWPCANQGEEEALSDVRRFEQSITVYPNQNAGGRRVRISYDANSLDIEVNGIRLGTVQPGIQVLEAITNLRGGGTRGVIYVDFLAPFLEGMERYFSQQFLGRTGRGRRTHPRRIITFARDSNNAQGTSSSQPLVPSWFTSSPHPRGGYDHQQQIRHYAARLSQFGDNEEDSRRVLSLAVETAASTANELLRRPVESRIERVLNSSSVVAGSSSSMGNMWNSQWSPAAQNQSSSSSGQRPRFSIDQLAHSYAQARMASQERLHDMQRQISLLSNTNWARGAASNAGSSNQHRAEEHHHHGSHHHWVIRRQRRFTNSPVQRPVTSSHPTSVDGGGAHPTSSVGGEDGDSGTSARTRAGGREQRDDGGDDQQGYSNGPEILVTPRATLNSSPPVPPVLPPMSQAPPPSYYSLETASTTSFLSSRIQKWDFSEFIVPDLRERNANVVVRECSLHSDACMDISRDSEFLAVLMPSEGGTYSSLGVYSLLDKTLGSLLAVYHFDQNTVSVSISPSSDFICIGYAGRGPMYRFVNGNPVGGGGGAGRNIGLVLSLKEKNGNGTLLPVRDLFAENSGTGVMAINCMHFLPIPGMGILYGTNSGELVLLQ